MNSNATLSDAELQRVLARAVELIGQGRAGAAARAMRDIASQRPDNFDILHVWGAAQALDGRHDDAIRLLGRAAAINPAAPAVWLNLGNAYLQVGRLTEAAETFAKGLTFTPNLAEASHRLCLALLAQDKVDEAAAQADAFVASYPDNTTANFAVGLVRVRQGRSGEAIASFRRAIEIDPSNLSARANLGFSLGSERRYTEALPILSEVVARQPKDWSAIEKLIHAKRSICDWSGLEELERRLVTAVSAERPNVDPWTLFSTTDRADILQRAAVSRTEATVPRLPPALRPAEAYTHDRIRLGYLAGDFRDHPVAHVMAALIEAHDRQRFEVIALAYGPNDGSPIHARIAAGCDRFVDLGADSAAMIAAKVRELEIDIAIDLSGPTEFGRPVILSHRPAPVQVSFLGYPGTSGASWLDYLIADAVTVPPNHDRHYVEHVARLPDCYFPPLRRPISEIRPARAEYGLADGDTVFASFNNSYKIRPQTFAVWMRILAGTANSVLWLRAAGDPAEANLRAAAKAHGIEPARLVFAPRLDDEADHLARLALADLFLDCGPYNAHTTASDALWAGLPVLTCPGQSFSSRVAASLLTAAGLPKLIMSDMAAYEATAVALASDPARLSALKARLVAGRDNSRLFDLDRYRDHLESAYFTMHERARKDLKHSPINVGGI